MKHFDRNKYADDYEKYVDRVFPIVNPYRENIEDLTNDLRNATESFKDELMNLEFVDPDGCSLYDEIDVWNIVRKYTASVNRILNNMEVVLNAESDPLIDADPECAD